MKMPVSNPEINYIGIEKYPSVLAAAINKINLQENKVSNLRLMRYDAIELNNVFEKNEVAKIYLNFSRTLGQRVDMLKEGLLQISF